MMFFSPDNGGTGEATGGNATSPASPSLTGSAASSPQPVTTGGNAGGLEGDASASIIGSQSDGGARNYVRSDGSFEDGWSNRLPDSLANARESLASFKNVEDLAKSYYETKQLVGRKGVILPTAESSPAEVTAFRKALGVPDSEDGYSQTVKPTEIPEGIQWNDEIAKSYYQVAHRHNVSAAAMKDLIALNLKQREFEIQAANDQVMETRQRGLSHLRSVWGADFDRNLGLAQRAAALGGADPNSYGWRDPEVVKLVVRMANMMGEDKFVGGGATLPVGAADLKSRAQDIMRNVSNPLHQRYRDGDPDVQAQVRNMLKQASGGK